MPNELLLVGGYGTSLGNAAALFDRTGLLPEYGLPRRPKLPPTGNLNIPLLIISAVIFITIVAWFNVISRWYEDTFVEAKDQGSRYRSTGYAIGYAFLVSGFSFIIALVAAQFM